MLWLTLFFGVFAAAVASFLAVWALLAIRTHRRYAHIPGPPVDSVLFGNLAELTRLRRMGMSNPIIFHNYHMQYGMVFRIFVLTRCIVITCHPTFVHDAFTKFPKMKEFVEQNFANYCGRRFAGRGLFSLANRAEHRRRRLFFNPAFHKGALINLMTEFNSTVACLVASLRDRCRSSPTGEAEVDLADVIGKTTMDVIAKVAFGMRLNSVTGDADSPFGRAVTTATQGFGAKLNDPLLALKPWMRGFVKNVHQSIAFLRNTGREIFEKRKRLSQSSFLAEDDDDNDSIMARMYEFEKQNPDYTIDEQVDDFVTFFIAGQETSASNIVFTLLHLDRHPTLKARATEEAEQVLGFKDHVDFADLNRLVFITNCLKEGLRLTPAATVVGREAERDYVVPEWKPQRRNGGDTTNTRGVEEKTPHDDASSGLIIPSKTQILVNIYSMHNHPAIWSRVDEFLPDRWGATSKENLEPFAYAPFSRGSRSCIGQVFAQIETRIVLSRLLLSFDYDVVEDRGKEDLVDDLILHLKRGLVVRLREKSA